MNDSLMLIYDSNETRVIHHFKQPQANIHTFFDEFVYFLRGISFSDEVIEQGLKEQLEALEDKKNGV